MPRSKPRHSGRGDEEGVAFGSGSYGRRDPRCGQSHSSLPVVLRFVAQRPEESLAAIGVDDPLEPRGGGVDRIAHRSGIARRATGDRNGTDRAHPQLVAERRIAARNDARKAKDFKESDRIRDELAKMGVVLKDSKDGTTWEAAR